MSKTPTNLLRTAANFIGFDFTASPKPAADKRNAGSNIIPLQLQRIAQDTGTWRDGVDEMERAYFPYRVKVQQTFVDTILNGHVKACMDRRNDLTMLRDWHIVGADGKATDEKATQLLNEMWFAKWMWHALNANGFGYSLISLGDLVDGKFPKLQIIRRWNVSPDRFVVSAVPYAPNGVNFIEDKDIAKWHTYIATPNEIGTSPCGYGYLYSVALYEIILRNILGYNGDFVELFSQPYRIGKTNKTEEAERAEFTAMVANMGSQGWAVVDDLGDTIEFLESSLGGSGTGWKGYENLEQRLEKKISKIILGHADALDSTPGKLGAGQGEDDPVSSALRDKQTKDGQFITDAINCELLPKLRKLGFAIPQTAKFEFKNDAEVADNNNKVTALAVELKKAGMQMDGKYYTQQTGIPLQEVEEVEPVVEAKPGETPAEKIENRLKQLYEIK